MCFVTLRVFWREELVQNMLMVFKAKSLIMTFGRESNSWWVFKKIYEINFIRSTCSEQPSVCYVLKALCLPPPPSPPMLMNDDVILHVQEFLKIFF